MGQDECGREALVARHAQRPTSAPVRRGGLEASSLRSRPSYRGTELVEPGGGGGGAGWGEGAAQEEVNGRPQRRESTAAQPRHLRLIPSCSSLGKEVKAREMDRRFPHNLGQL